MTDFVVAGLGNPGIEHAGNRHNVGFWAVNRLAKRHGIGLKANRNDWTGKGRIDGAEVVLTRPKTWMNRSGIAIAPLLKREGVLIESLVVVYDELDLPEGRIRIRPKGGSGGHNGLRSIISSTGSSDFGRIRIGIGRPLYLGVPTWDPEIVMRWVLGDPPREAREVLEQAVERACDAIEAVIERGWERAMDVYNRDEAKGPASKEQGTGNGEPQEAAASPPPEV
jgi:PTH1 family peptidyl-tRNA hydrolase